MAQITNTGEKEWNEAFEMLFKEGTKSATTGTISGYPNFFDVCDCDQRCLKCGKRKAINKPYVTRWSCTNG